MEKEEWMYWRNIERDEAIQIQLLRAENKRLTAVKDAAIERLNGSLSRLQKFIDLQAEDEGLWCISEHASEAYIQRGLRGCHAMIEQELEALADEK